MSTPHTKTTLRIVALIVFIDMIGIGLIMPVMPGLIGEVAGSDLSHAAQIGGGLLFAYAAMQFLFSSVIGGLSDHFGRRPMLLITLTVLGLDYAIMAIAPTLGWLVIGRLVSGIMGASWVAANSCVADVVPKESRGAAFGVLGGAGAAGFVLGPALGGIAGEFGVRLPFIVAAIIALSGAIIGFFLLKETLPEKRRRSFSLARANPLGTLMQIGRTRFILGCLLTIFFMQLSAQAQMSIWAYWGELSFDWTPLTSGLTITLYGVMLGMMQGLVVGKAIQRFGARKVACWSVLFGLPSYLLLAMATQTSTVIFAILIGSVTGLTFPALQSLMSARTSEDAQGELQGGIGSTIGLTSIIGPPVMTQIFGHFTNDSGLFFPGAPYVLSIILLVIAAVILWYTLARAPEAEPSPS